jgi:hypothetical protein
MSTGAASDYLERKLLDHIFRNIEYTSPSRVYIGLFPFDPTDTNAADTEVSGTWYARQDPAAGGTPDTGFNQTVTGTVTNAKSITFPPVAGVDAETLIHVAYAGVYDAPTGGNLLWHGSLNLSKDLSLGDILTLPVGSVTFTLD